MTKTEKVQAEDRDRFIAMNSLLQHPGKAMKDALYGPEFEKQQADYLDQMLRMLSTVGAQQSNRASEFAAYNDLPSASAAALQRGVDYNTLLQGRETGVDLTRQGNELRMGNIRFLLGLQQQKKIADQQAEAAKWGAFGNILGGLGGAVGAFFGAKAK